LEEAPIGGLFLDWDNTPFDDTSDETIVAGRDEEGHLHFADVEAANGEFQKLESWAKEHGICFERRSEAKYDYDAQRTWFRPDLPEAQLAGWTYTTQEGEPLVPVVYIAEIVAKMRRLDKDTRRSAAQREKTWHRLLDKLASALPPDMPPLPPFEILDE
jgi:hypothetical protein